MTYKVYGLKDFRTKKRNKYKAKKKEYGGRYYHSALEAKVAQDLDWQLKAGEIKEVVPQYKLDLRINGKHLCNYYVDFKVTHNDGCIEFIEVKGLELELWRLKWRILEAILPSLKKELGTDIGLTVIKK